MGQSGKLIHFHVFFLLSEYLISFDPVGTPTVIIKSLAGWMTSSTSRVIVWERPKLRMRW
jgi:hypothetical protein